jgi:nicotinamidase-related amidase
VAFNAGMKTLLIIDMQNAWLANPATPRHDAAGVIARIAHAAACIRAQAGRVIYIQHEADDAIAGSPAWNIIEALQPKSGETTVDKRACDPFAGSDLAEQLASLAGDTLYLCGFATEFCVDSAVRACASRALNLVVLSDAHTTSNRPHLSAQDIIAHHNWIWANMAVPAASTLAVNTTAQAFG